MCIVCTVYAVCFNICMFVCLHVPCVLCVLYVYFMYCMACMYYMYSMYVRYALHAMYVLNAQVFVALVVDNFVVLYGTGRVFRKDVFRKEAVMRVLVVSQQHSIPIKLDKYIRLAGIRLHPQSVRTPAAAVGPGAGRDRLAWGHIRIQCKAPEDYTKP